jgi:UDP-GlcNAc3NAcA epimerase
VTDHLARWCFAPTEDAVANLAAEGLTSEVHLVGDVMRDLAARELSRVHDASALAGMAGGGLRTGEFPFATVHRAENQAPDAIPAGWLA